MFLSWPEEVFPRFDVVFNGDSKRTATIEGWTTHIDNETRILGFALDANARRLLGEATSLQIRHDGKSVLVLPLAHTPSERELERCVPPPPGLNSDSELAESSQ